STSAASPSAPSAAAEKDVAMLKKTTVPPEAVARIAPCSQPGTSTHTIVTSTGSPTAAASATGSRASASATRSARPLPRSSRASASVGTTPTVWPAPARRAAASDSDPVAGLETERRVRTHLVDRADEHPARAGHRVVHLPAGTDDVQHLGADRGAVPAVLGGQLAVARGVQVEPLHGHAHLVRADGRRGVQARRRLWQHAGRVQYPVQSDGRGHFRGSLGSGREDFRYPSLIAESFPAWEGQWEGNRTSTGGANWSSPTG